MKKRRVVVEKVAILEESGSPAPRNVEVLGLIGVESVSEVREGVDNAGHDGNADQSEPLAPRHLSHLIGAP